MPRPRSLLLTAASFAAASFAAPARAGGEACVPPAVTAALADCSIAPSLPAMSPAYLLKSGSSAPPAAPMALAKLPKGLAPAPRPFDDAETTLAGAYHRFACDDHPAPGDTAARDLHMEVAYRRARLYFDAHRFQEAAALFRDIAASGDPAPLSVYAMQLYLESIAVLGRQGAAACFDDVARDVPVFLGTYCQGGREKTNADACGMLERIQRDLERLAAEKEVVAAGRLLGEEAMDWYRAGAERYLAIWHRVGEGACAAKQPGCERMEEILYNAARAYQAARDIPKAIAVRQILFDPKYHLEGTLLGQKVPYEIGGTYQALAEYEQAATWYERYAAASPKTEKAPDALQDAVVLRLGLGQEEMAVRDSELFDKNYGDTRPAQAARIAFAIGAHDVAREDWPEARKKLTNAMSRIDRAGTLDVQIQAHGLLGRVLVKLGKPSDAAGELEKVRAYWKDPARTVNKIYDASGDDRQLAKALTALGEALFFFAEEKRKAAAAVGLPAYTGSGRSEDIAEFVAKKLAPAMTARRKAVEEADRAYRAVLEIEPEPPPRWVVSASARVARMYGKLAAEVRALPAPKAWKRQGPSPWGTRWEDVRAAWRDAMIAASEQEYRAARASYQSCVEHAVKWQWFDDDVRRCAAWISRNDPADHPRLDEIAPRPRHLSSGFVEPRPLGELPGLP